MMRVKRFDTGELRPSVKQPNGFLRVDGRISRIGVQIYQNADGTMRRELRLPEEVFSATSIASFHQVPVTNLHPPKLLDAKTAKQYTVGSIGENLRRDGHYLVAPMMIHDEAAVADAEAGRSQLSCGYDCNLEMRSGYWDSVSEKIAETGEPFDAIQRQISGNHVALVDLGRAGAGASMRLDQLDEGAACMVASPQQPTEPEKTTMPLTIRIDGRTFEVTDSHAPVIQVAIDELVARVRADGDKLIGSEKSRADGAVTAKTAAESTLTQLQAKWDAAKARRDARAKALVKCDECAGKGEIKADSAATTSKCDGCDGKGEFPAGDDDDDEENEDKKKDKKKRDQKRADSRARTFDRAVRERVALEVSARKVLGDDFKLDALDALGVKRAVVCKLDGVEKLEREDAAYVDARFDIASKRADQAPGPTDADKVRALALGGGGNRSDGGGKKPPTNQADARADYITRRQDAWKQPKV